MKSIMGTGTSTITVTGTTTSTLTVAVAIAVLLPQRLLRLCTTITTANR